MQHGKNMQSWQNFVSRFFNGEGVFRQTIWDSTNDRTKFFEIPAASLPRYYWTNTNSGVVNMQLTFEGASEKDLPNSGAHSVHCEKARITYWYTNGTQVRNPVLAIWS